MFKRTEAGKKEEKEKWKVREKRCQDLVVMTVLAPQ
jgi:hypothetical protein